MSGLREERDEAGNKTLPPDLGPLQEEEAELERKLTEPGQDMGSPHTRALLRYIW